VPAAVLAHLDELRPLVGYQVRVAGWDYAVWLLPDGSVQVLDNTCEHIGGPIVDGAIDDGCVVCPWHGWRYVLATGQRRPVFGDLPGIGSYPARVVDGVVIAELPADRCR
jgi:nitrite reductase/ring-hydroxylating ferredoxin subunit